MPRIMCNAEETHDLPSDFRRLWKHGSTPWLEDPCLAEQASIHIRAGKEKTWTHEAPIADLDLTD